MRRILAMLLSVFFSIFNNTNYVASSKPNFNPGGIYMFENEDGYTTQELNEKRTGTDDTNETPQKDDDATKQGGTYSPTAGKKLSNDDLDQTKYTWSDEDIQKNKRIVMPEDGTVINDENKGNGGHDLTIKAGDKTFEFRNMQCRYPEINKEQQEVWTNIEDLTGRKISSGSTIGIAKVGTTLEIKENGKAIALKDYYK